MGLLYDITKDYLYQEGRTKGREEGIVEGLTKGREEGREEGLTKGREQVKREAVAKMLAKQKLSIEEIADALEVTVAYVETIAKELRR
jgi:predicted transposase YdaD